MQDALNLLFASVCHALRSAGYELSTTDPTRPGLFVTKDNANARIRWTPTAELVTPDLLRANTGSAPLRGMQDAVQTALSTVLTTAGFMIAEPSEPDTLHVTYTAVAA